MTGVSAASDSLRQARGRLALSWEATQAGWKDKRAREFERRFQVPLEQATLTCERSLERLDRELSGIVEELPG